jgi:hypothetical protein
MKRHALLLMLVLSMTTMSLAQEAAESAPVGPDPNQPAAGDVLQHIPADAMAFFVAPNLKDLLADSETFAGKIGMGEPLGAVAPQGLLSMMSMALSLGEGYNPNGGVAMVVTDLKKSGIDVEAIAAGNAPPGTLPPVVLLVAGKSADTIFPQMAQNQEDGTVVVNVMGMPMQTAQLGDYVAMSPSPQALAQIGQGASITSALPARHAKLLRSSRLGVYYNMQAVGPAVEAVMKGMQKSGGPGLGPMGAPLQMMNLYKGFVDQLGPVSYGVKFVDTGMTLEVLVDYMPGSDLAKQAAGVKPTAKPLVNRVPSTPYVMAGGTMMYSGDTQMVVDQTMQVITQMLQMGGLEMPANLKQDMAGLYEEFLGLVTQIQFAGGAPAETGQGVFGMAFVLECTDAEKVKALIPRKTAIMNRFIQKTVAMKEEELKDVEFIYTPNVKQVGGVSVDTVQVKSMKMETMTPEEKTEMIQILAEDEVKFYVAQVDPKTIVVTLGGGESYLAKAIETARKGGMIPTDPGVIEAARYLPKTRVQEMFFSPANLYQTIQDGMKTMGEDSNLPADFTFQGKTPIALGSTIEGNTASIVVYVPASAVKDMIKWVEAEEEAQRKRWEEENNAQQQGGGEDAPPPAQDF